VIKKCTIASIVLLFVSLNPSYTQSFNAGFHFQYHILKQIDVDAHTITGTYSHEQFKVKENNWKSFAAGQSIVVGMMTQMDYKKFYLTMELSFNLNTYRYSLFYPIGPSKDERVNFKTLYQQMEVPLYLGYQFQSTNLIRYSFFGGAMINVPVLIQTFFDDSKEDRRFQERYDLNDLRYILYNNDPYFSGMFGLGIHIARLAKVDLRYIHRFGSPGDVYDVKFNTIGISFTYYLPLDLKKQKFYYEEQ
jgi:hypothetical protein